MTLTALDFVLQPFDATEVYVRRWAVATEQLRVRAGESVAWRFQVGGRYDIEFFLLFLPRQGTADGDHDRQDDRAGDGAADEVAQAFDLFVKEQRHRRPPSQQQQQQQHKQQRKEGEEEKKTEGKEEEGRKEGEGDGTGGLVERVECVQEPRYYKTPTGYIQGSFRAPEDGVVRVCWSNAHSRFVGKYITFVLQSVPAAVLAAAREAATDAAAALAGGVDSGSRAPTAALPSATTADPPPISKDEVVLAGGGCSNDDTTSSTTTTTTAEATQAAEGQSREEKQEKQTSDAAEGAEGTSGSTWQTVSSLLLVAAAAPVQIGRQAAATVATTAQSTTTNAVSMFPHIMSFLGSRQGAATDAPTEDAAKADPETSAPPANTNKNDGAKPEIDENDVVLAGDSSSAVLELLDTEEEATEVAAAAASAEGQGESDGSPSPTADEDADGDTGTGTGTRSGKVTADEAWMLSSSSAVSSLFLRPMFGIGASRTERQTLDVSVLMRLANEIEDLEDRNAMLLAERDTARAENERLSVQMEQQEVGQRRLQQALDDVRARDIEAEQTTLTLQQTSRTLSTVEEQVVELQANLSASQEECQDYRGRVQEVQAQMQEADAKYRLVLADMAAKQRHMIDVLAATQAEAEEARMMERAAERKTRRLRAEKKLLVNEIKTLRAMGLYIPAGGGAARKAQTDAKEEAEPDTQKSIDDAGASAAAVVTGQGDGDGDGGRDDDDDERDNDVDGERSDLHKGDGEREGDGEGDTAANTTPSEAPTSEGAPDEERSATSALAEEATEDAEQEERAPEDTDGQSSELQQQAEPVNAAAEQDEAPAAAAESSTMTPVGGEDALEDAVEDAEETDHAEAEPVSPPEEDKREDTKDGEIEAQSTPPAEELPAPHHPTVKPATRARIVANRSDPRVTKLLENLQEAKQRQATIALRLRSDPHNQMFLKLARDLKVAVGMIQRELRRVLEIAEEADEA